MQNYTHPGVLQKSGNAICMPEATHRARHLPACLWGEGVGHSVGPGYNPGWAGAPGAEGQRVPPPTVRRPALESSDSASWYSVLPCLPFLADPLVPSGQGRPCRGPGLPCEALSCRPWCLSPSCLGPHLLPPQIPSRPEGHLLWMLRGERPPCLHQPPGQRLHIPPLPISPQASPLCVSSLPLLQPTGMLVTTSGPPGPSGMLPISRPCT